MALRLIEVTLPAEDAAAVPDLLTDCHVVHIWTPDTEGEGGVRILLEAQDAEDATDVLVKNFGGKRDFRILLLPVEATLPAVERTEKPEPEVEAAPKKKRSSRISREELYEDVVQAGSLTSIYVVMVALSTLVAAVGLVRGDTAIVIGAMVIAPLLGPNVALALASTLGDPDLASRSLKATFVGVGVAALISITLGAALTVDPASSPEVASRTGADVGDVVLALAAGAAGTLAFTSGVPSVLVGVMVAVALLPPLVVAGLMLGSGQLGLALGATVLLLTNVTCVNLAAVGTFLAQDVGPRTWWEADRAKRSTRLAVTTWITMLFVLLALILLGYVREG